MVVNGWAEPLGKITNVCVIEANEIRPKTAIETTDVNCWNPGIIYVDIYDVDGDNTGMSWEHAYTDLQDALERARNCGCNQIQIAEGKYKPTKGSNRSISFDLLDGIAIEGGFPPGGGAWTERNPYVYETILSGDIAEPNYQYDNSYHVVKCVDVNNAVLDGFTITAGKADGSGAHEYGGGMYCWDSYGLILRNCRISDNSACYGGAIYDYNSFNMNITNCIFAENTYEYNGGGIYNYQSSPSIINCTFSGNSATTVGNSYGGAIYNTNSSEPNISNCTFNNNSAEKGGAVYNYYTGPKISNCVFNSNTAIDYGGGMVNSNESSPTIINCTFSGNSATTVGFSYGGAICNWDSSDPNITNCTFSDNSAHEGGALYNKSSDPNIANCIFTANDANMGGGLYNTSSSPYITNCIFIGNIADSYGGGMHDHNCPLVTITNCIFNGNQAYYFGGGMDNYDNSQLVMTNCTVSGNWAHYGGGICNWYYSDVNLTNCIFWNNVAGTDGNEIYNDYETSDINVTFCDVNEVWTGNGNIDKDPCFFEVNQPDGSWTDDASYDSSTFQSTLTDGDANWAVNELAGKFVNPHVNIYPYLQFFIVSNDVNTIKVWSNVEYIAYTGKAYQIYDYHLTTDSPCIDSGDPNGDYSGQKDIDGEPRVFDGDDDEVPIVDMGADEYYWSPADINSDGFVNFFDYTFFASAWQSVPNDPNYNEDCDLEDNDLIDYNDIALFCEDWLWQTAWAKAFPSPYDELWGRGMSMGEGFFPSMQVKQIQPEITAEDIEEILKWLADLWLTNEEVRKTIPEDEWQKFIEAVIQAAKEQIYN